MSIGFRMRVSALWMAGLLLAAAPFEASALEIRINDIPLSALEEQGRGSVGVEHVNGGTQWKVALGGDAFVVTEGRAAVKERVEALVRALDNDPRVPTAQRQSAVEELRKFESHLEARSASFESLTDCRGSLNFEPTIQRNMWYGRVWSTLSWSMWPGPPAPWQNWIYARAIAEGTSYYDSGWESYGPFSTTSGVTVTAYAAAGPESTYGIVLYAYAFFDSTGCQPLWFEYVNSL
jgi:hypothetical protein